MDLNTNKWETCEFENFDDLKQELLKISPSEIILSKKLYKKNKISEILDIKSNLNIFFYEYK